MKISILIPATVVGNVTRTEAMKFCVKRWQSIMPASEICIGGSNHIPFNRSAALNASHSKSHGDVFIVADADTIINELFVLRAINLIQDGPCWSIPFTNYYSMPKDSTERILNGSPGQLLFEPTFDPVPTNNPPIARGIHVITREGWEKCGPCDEGFIGWGCEDGQRKALMFYRLGTPNIVPGFCMHLWHERKPEESKQNPFMKKNSERLEQFRKGLQ